jgi:hypothetical protein
MKTVMVPEPTIKVDDGFYAEARALRKPAPLLLAERDPVPDELVEAAESRFYTQHGKDPADFAHFADGEHPVRQWARGRAALAGQLAWYEKQHGQSITTVQDFYTNTALTSLFPAWIETEIQAGLIANGLVQDLVFGTEQVDSSRVTALYDSTPERERELRVIGEGAELPRVTLTFSDSTIALHKYGRQINASYETIGSQKVDALGHHIRRIAAQVAVDETDQALHVLVAGDGTVMGAAETDATDTDVAGAGSIAYSDLISWYFDMGAPYLLDRAVFGDTDLALISNLAEFKTDSYRDFGGNFSVPGPKAVKYLRWNGGVGGSAYVDRLGIGIDSRQALRKYVWGGFLQEQDKIISRQVSVWTFSYWAGFRKWDSAATQVLDCNDVL